MFEIHVTVEADNLSDFVKWCEGAGVKPMYLKGKNLKQVQYK